jgi:hypothetical protein
MATYKKASEIALGDAVIIRQERGGVPCIHRGYVAELNFRGGTFPIHHKYLFTEGRTGHWSYRPYELVEVPKAE